MRKVILHYHLFKNAGTSVDAVLKQSFSNSWVTREFTDESKSERNELQMWIRQTDAICYSSHTASLPPPVIEDIYIFPVIFMRHPIDRIASAYTFEKRQSDNGFGAVLAQNTSMAGYIETRLSLDGDRQCRNFHTYRFSQMFEDGSEISRAKRALYSLPFVGLVERFNLSLERLEYLLREESFGSVHLKPVQKNVSRYIRKPIDIKLSEIKREIGGRTYTKLIEANREDLELYELCCHIYNLGIYEVEAISLDE